MLLVYANVCLDRIVAFLNLISVRLIIVAELCHISECRSPLCHCANCDVEDDRIVAFLNLYSV